MLGSIDFHLNFKRERFLFSLYQRDLRPFNCQFSRFYSLSNAKPDGSLLLILYKMDLDSDCSFSWDSIPIFGLVYLCLFLLILSYLSFLLFFGIHVTDRFLLPHYYISSTPAARRSIEKAKRLAHVFTILDHCDTATLQLVGLRWLIALILINIIKVIFIFCKDSVLRVLIKRCKEPFVSDAWILLSLLKSHPSLDFIFPIILLLRNNFTFCLFDWGVFPFFNLTNIGSIILICVIYNIERVSQVRAADWIFVKLLVIWNDHANQL